LGGRAVFYGRWMTGGAGGLEPRAAQPAGAAGLDLSLGHI
jgi:hypothetical protein